MSPRLEEARRLAGYYRKKLSRRPEVVVSRGVATLVEKIKSGAKEFAQERGITLPVDVPDCPTCGASECPRATSRLNTCMSLVCGAISDESQKDGPCARNPEHAGKHKDANGRTFKDAVPR